jgi:tRNA threonylcarbamoyladenosine biosynthesis protein TsaB
MKILALDSSGLVASVAIIEDDLLIAEYTMNYKKTHSQTLLPMLDEVKKQINLDLSTIDLIAVAAGPGSFTGLRIGSSTAKGLGLALDKKVVGIPTVHALAYNLYGNEQVICPIMDARRSQVYTGLFTFEKDHSQTGEVEYRFKILKEQAALPIEEIIHELNELGKEVVFLGDGVPVFGDVIKETLTVPYSFAPAGFNRQRATTIGNLATKGYKIEGAAAHRPEYLRLSQAERERLERGES